MLTEYFLDNLQALLTKSELSRVELARDLGLPQSTINNWFSRANIPSMDRIELLAERFKVPPYWLFMPPGTQKERNGVFEHKIEDFFDDLAAKTLNEEELKHYQLAGGSYAYIQALKENYETDQINIQSWYRSLNKEVAKYVNLDIAKKVSEILISDSQKK